MSQKLRPIKPEQLVKIVEKLGFVKIRQKGSHIVYHHPDGRWITIPMHKGRDISVGLLRKIIKDLGITVEEFNKLR